MNRQILSRAGIDPRSVLHVEEVHNECPWCFTECGTLACLLPCEHEFCETCMYSIIDSEYDTCPICDEFYSDYSMDSSIPLL